MRHNLIICCLAIVLLSASPLNAQITMGNYTSHVVTDSSLTIFSGSSSLVLTSLYDGIVKIEFFPTPSTEQDSSYIVPPGNSTPVNSAVQEEDNYLVLSNLHVSVRVEKYPVHLSFELNGATVLEEGQHGTVADGDQRIVRFINTGNEAFWGTGGRGQALNLAGHAFPLENMASYGYSDPPSAMNTNVPFLVSSKKYGLLFDTSWTGYFDLAFHDPSHNSFTAYGGELRYYFIPGAETGPELAPILASYMLLTGRQPLPPKWSLGYLQSKFGYHNQAEAIQVAQQLRDEDIPADGLILDLYWFNHMGDYDWDLSAFPDPEGMIDALDDMGFKTIVITEPYFVQSSSNYSMLFNNPGWVGRTDTGDPFILPNHWSCGCDALLFDMTTPDATDWLRGQYENLLGQGVAGFWTDLGEPENHPWEMMHTGGSRNEVHNIYNLEWSKVVADAFGDDATDSRVFNLTRSGYGGSQRYGVNTWSGDVSRTWQGLAAQPAMMLNMGLSGMAYHSSDIGGFTGTSTPELYVRWVQMGVVSPMLRAHGFENHGTEPWAFGEEAEDIARKYIKLRYSLLPYLYSAAAENNLWGDPIVRPLFYDDPSNTLLQDVDEAWFLGPDIVAAPVLEEGATSKSLPLPSGEWVNFWTDEIYQGGGWVTVDAPLQTLPLFVRRGAAIPMQSDHAYVGSDEPDTLKVVYYPAEGQDLYRRFYEDDGISQQYQHSGYSDGVILTWTETRGGVTTSDISILDNEGFFEGQLENRTYLIDVRHIASPPTGVFIVSDQLSYYPSYDELLVAGRGVWFDEEQHRLLALVTGPLETIAPLVLSDFTLSVESRPATPTQFSLEQNYPNPFNASTVIRYTIPERQQVHIAVYDILGREVTILSNEVQRAGEHAVSWHTNTLGSSLGSGIYFCRLKTASETKTIRMLLIK